MEATQSRCVSRRPDSLVTQSSTNAHCQPGAAAGALVISCSRILLQELLGQDPQPVLAIFKQGFQFHDRGPMLGVGGRRRAPLMVVVTW